MSFVLLLNFLQFTSTALAVDAPPSPSEGLNQTYTAIGSNNAALKNEDIKITIGRAIGAVLALVGIIFFILMIYGGMLWMMARGDEAQVTKARELITAAIIGLVIVLSAYAITSYLGTQLTGST